MKKEHKHIFKNTGGGLNLKTGKSDDHYKCKCGMEFKVYSNSLGHRFLPKIIKEEKFSNVKRAEQKSILET